VDADTWRLDANALAPGRTAKFRLRRGDTSVEGFAINHGGAVFAYVNRCPHAGNPLDGRADTLLTPDGRYLACSIHGAVFAPDTGICVEGPCPGARLERLDLVRSGAAWLIRWPA
jgi:nitrite reductase/ring-hydroxylating ferredoxin subunit